MLIRRTHEVFQHAGGFIICRLRRRLLRFRVVGSWMLFSHRQGLLFYQRKNITAQWVFQSVIAIVAAWDFDKASPADTAVPVDTAEILRLPKLFTMISEDKEIGQVIRA